MLQRRHVWQSITLQQVKTSMFLKKCDSVNKIWYLQLIKYTVQHVKIQCYEVRPSYRNIYLAPGACCQMVSTEIFGLKCCSRVFFIFVVIIFLQSLFAGKTYPRLKQRYNGAGKNRWVECFWYFVISVKQKMVLKSNLTEKIFFRWYRVIVKRVSLLQTIMKKFLVDQNIKNRYL